MRPKHLQSKFEDSQVVYTGSATDKTAIEEFITKVHKLTPSLALVSLYSCTGTGNHSRLLRLCYALRYALIFKLFGHVFLF